MNLKDFRDQEANQWKVHKDQQVTLNSGSSSQQILTNYRLITIFGLGIRRYLFLEGIYQEVEVLNSCCLVLLLD